MTSLSDRTFLEDALHELNRRAGALVAEASLLQESLDEVTGEARGPAELLIQDVDRLRVFLRRLAALLRTDDTDTDDTDTDDTDTDDTDTDDTECFDVVHLARQVCDREGRRGRVVVQAPANVLVGCARGPVAEALAILVDNALLHGGGAAQVSIEPNADDVRVVVADEGPGLPPALAPQAFHPFAPAQVGLVREGSGLGLALAHALLRSVEAPLVYRPADPGAIFSFPLRKGTDRTPPRSVTERLRTRRGNDSNKG